MTKPDVSLPNPVITELTTQFSDLARAMMISQLEAVQPERVVHFAAEAVAGSQHAALTVIRGTQPPKTVAATSELPYKVDSIQYETGQGPCLQALSEGDIIRADDLATDHQWPIFAPRAVAETGIRSMFSVRLFLDAEHRGALNFYAMQPTSSPI